MAAIYPRLTYHMAFLEIHFCDSYPTQTKNYHYLFLWPEATGMKCDGLIFGGYSLLTVYRAQRGQQLSIENTRIYGKKITKAINKSVSDLCGFVDAKLSGMESETVKASCTLMEAESSGKEEPVGR